MPGSRRCSTGHYPPPLAHITRTWLLPGAGAHSGGEGAFDARAGVRERDDAARGAPIKTIATAIDGNGPSAMALLEKHTPEYPRDGLGLGPGRWLAEGARNIA